MNNIKTTPMALKEILVAADNCLNKYDKKKEGWEEEGVLGFPAALLLLSFVDAVGFLLLIKGTPEDLGTNSVPGKNFDILKEKKYFSNPLTCSQRDRVYNLFRGYIFHQSILADGTGIVRNKTETKILYKDHAEPEYWRLNLSALYDECVNLFNNNIVEINSKSDQEIFVGVLKI